MRLALLTTHLDAVVDRVIDGDTFVCHSAVPFHG